MNFTSFSYEAHLEWSHQSVQIKVDGDKWYLNVAKEGGMHQIVKKNWWMPRWVYAYVQWLISTSWSICRIMIDWVSRSPGGLFQHKLLSLIPRIYDLGNLKWCRRIGILASFQVTEITGSKTTLGEPLRS